MSLDTDIRDMLRSREVQSINFRFGHVHIHGGAYRVVSNCFSDTPIRGRIRVTVNPSIVPHGASAAYDQPGNKINLRSANVMYDRYQSAEVLHECTHAIFDIRRQRRSWIPAEEACCYIAQTIYAISIPGLMVDWNGNFETFGQIDPEFIRIAQQIKRDRIANPHQPAQVSEADRRIAQSVVRDHYGYVAGHYTGADGIPGRRIPDVN